MNRPCDCCEGKGLLQYEKNGPFFSCPNCSIGFDVHEAGIKYRDEDEADE